jgi:hypothetical protein
MVTVSHSPKKGYRTIRLPLAESEYDRFLSDRAYARSRLDNFMRTFLNYFLKPFHGAMLFTDLQSPQLNRRYSVDAFVLIKARQSLLSLLPSSCLI